MIASCEGGVTRTKFWGSGHCTPVRQRPSASVVLIYTSSERVINNNGLMTFESRCLRSLYYISPILLNFMLGVRFRNKITVRREPPRLGCSFTLQVNGLLTLTVLMTSESRYLRSLHHVSPILPNFILGVWFPHKITLCKDPPSPVVSFILQVNDFLRISDW